MTHTRGPWELDGTRMVLGPCFTGELKSIVDKVRGGSPAEADANARLIAAAPDLLAALAKIAEYPRQRNDELSIAGARAIARDAIDAATRRGK